jgi:hypothetical protein
MRHIIAVFLICIACTAAQAEPNPTEDLTIRDSVSEETYNLAEIGVFHDYCLRIIELQFRHGYSLESVIDHIGLACLITFHKASWEKRVAYGIVPGMLLCTYEDMYGKLPAETWDDYKYQLKMDTCARSRRVWPDSELTKAPLLQNHNGPGLAFSIENRLTLAEDPDLVVPDLVDLIYITGKFVDCGDLLIYLAAIHPQTARDVASEVLKRSNYDLDQHYVLDVYRSMVIGLALSDDFSIFDSIPSDIWEHIEPIYIQSCLTDEQFKIIQQMHYPYWIRE